MNESFSALGLLASGADVLAINFQHVLNTILKWQGVVSQPVGGEPGW
jgi:hypothetical protein